MVFTGTVFRDMDKIISKKKRLIFIFSIVICFTGLLLINRSIIKNRRENVKYRIESLAKYQIKSLIDKNVAYSKLWGAMIQSYDGDMSQDAFNELSEKLMSDLNDPSIRCMQIAPDAVIKYIYPIEGNESVLNRDLTQGMYKKEILSAIETGLPTLDGPRELVQGGNACLFFNPLYIDNEKGEKEFWGLSIAILSFPELFSNIDFTTESNIYDFKISHIKSSTNEKDIFLKSTDKKFYNPVVLQFEVANAVWTIEAEWKGGWITVSELLIQVLMVVLVEFIAILISKILDVQFQNEFAVREMMNDSDEAMCVVSSDASQVYMCNKAFLNYFGEVDKFVQGLDFKSFFKKNLKFEKLLIDKEVLVYSDKIGSEMVVRATESSWIGKKAYMLRATEYDKDYFDSLTLLPAQAYFANRATQEINEIHRSGREAICIFYDIIHMKLYNAHMGFEAGDKLLMQTAKILAEVYPGRLVSRFSNDHFVVIAENDNFEEKIKKVHIQVSKLGGSMKTEIKAGVFHIKKDYDKSVSEICDAAKMAEDSIHDDVDKIYREFDDELKKSLEESKFISDNIDKAIENDEIKVYYQPIIRAITGQICGYEALARWESPKLGFLVPYRFISVLEETHQIHKLDSHLIELVCRDLKKLLDKGEKIVPVSFNLSRLDFELVDVYRMVEDIVNKYEIDKAFINIEITESLLSDDKHISKVMDKLHLAGYKVWMDDFGSGYSSLNTLKDYSFDKIKIDMVFLSSFTDKSKTIIRSIVQMAKKIGIRTLAEGCESREQFEFLRDIGCEEIQGFYFGRPESFEKNIGDLKGKNFSLENMEDRSLYQMASRTEFDPESAMAIFEFSDDKIEDVYKNDLFINTATMFWPKVEDALDSVNHKAGQFYEGFRRRIDQCLNTDGEDHFSFNIGNKNMEMGIYVIAKYKDRLMIKVVISKTTIYTKEDK